MLCVLAACSAGTPRGALLPAQPYGAGVPASEPDAAKTGVTLKFLIPKSGPRSRRSHYVSPGTKSVAGSIGNKAGRVAFAFDTDPKKNAACVAGVPDVTCSVRLSLREGTYAIDVATYGGPLSKGKPAGPKLSLDNGIPMRVGAKPVALTLDDALDGIPASVAFVPATPSAFAGSATRGYVVSKCMGAQTVGVYGVDAKGYLIVGAGAPAVSLRSSDAKVLAIATPPPSAPNAFSIAPPARPAPGATVTLLASAAPPRAAGAAVSTRIALTFNRDICGDFSEYPLRNPGSQPVGIAVGSDGAVWFTEWAGNAIGRIDASGRTSEYPIPTASAQPRNIVTGPDRALWFTEGSGHPPSNGGIGRITTKGAVTDYPSIPKTSSGSYPVSAPFGIAPGPNGTVWFTDSDQNALGEFPVGSPQSAKEYALPSYPGQNLNYLILGPDNALYFSSYQNVVWRYPSTGAFSRFTDAAPSSLILNLVVGPDKAIWFANAEGFVGRMTTAGAFTDYSTNAPGRRTEARGCCGSATAPTARCGTSATTRAAPTPSTA